MKTDTSALGLSKTEAKRKPYIGSMGIYLFRMEVLEKVVDRNAEFIDFAREIIPDALSWLKVNAFIFKGYWEDIGTIRSFYDAHMDLIAPVPRFNLFDSTFPVFTHPRFLPGSKVARASVERSIVNAGCMIEDSRIIHSIVGLRSRIGAGTVIEDSLIFGADFYELGAGGRSRKPRLGIGTKSAVRRAIIDKNVRIGKRVVLENADGLDEYDDPRGRFFVRDGIIVVPKGAVIPDGTRF